MANSQERRDWSQTATKTDAPSSITYSSVVSRDSVRIAFTLAALNDLEIMARSEEHTSELQSPS